MSEQHAGGYAYYKTVDTDPATRAHERPEPERRATDTVWLDRDEVCEKLGVTYDDFQQLANVKYLGFPAAMQFFDRRKYRTELRWSEADLVEWAARLKDKIATLEGYLRKF